MALTTQCSAGALLLLVLAAAAARADSGMCTSKPPDTDAFSSSGGCGAPAAAPAEEEQDYPQLIDITVPLAPGLVLWQSSDGVPSSFKSLGADMAKGDPFYATNIKMGVHTGTHVDAPAHYVQEEWDAGNTVDKLDLEVLVGPALVVQVPSDTNITAEVLASLDLPGSLTRLLFKTRNTERNLMHTTAFASDYVGMTTDGAQWLVDNTQVKLVGIDYVSIASLDHLVKGHQVLLRKHIVPVEGLDLRALQAGHWYHLTCLPLNIPGAEGAPTRCVAFGPQDFEMMMEHEGGHHQEGEDLELGGEDDLGDWEGEGEGNAPLGSEDEL